LQKQPIMAETHRCDHLTHLTKSIITFKHTVRSTRCSVCFLGIN